MRRAHLNLVATSVGVVAFILSLVGAFRYNALAFAPSSPASPAAAPPSINAGQLVCNIASSTIRGLSGLIATSSGYVAINDSQLEKSDIKIFFFDNACKTKSIVAYPTAAFDPEDLAQSPDGTLWIADIGDNPLKAGGSGKRRETIALWKLSPGVGQKPVIHRLTYPDGPRDAEAVVINGDGSPIIITKQDDQSKIGSPSELYVPTAPLQSNNSVGVPLKKVGEVKLPGTNTPNPLSAVGRGLVTGAAVSPDRKKVVLRTYADAFEWEAPQGDFIKAMTSGTPRITPLPNESFGEAISYSVDGKTFLTINDNDNDGDSGTTNKTSILRYVPSVATAPAKEDSKKSSDTSNESGSSGLSFDDLTYMIAGIGILGLVLVIVGIIGIYRSREERKKSARARKNVHGDKPSHDHDAEDPGDDRAAAGLMNLDDEAGNSRNGVQARPGTVYGHGPGHHASHDQGRDAHTENPFPDHRFPEDELGERIGGNGLYGQRRGSSGRGTRW